MSQPGIIIKFNHLGDRTLNKNNGLVLLLCFVSSISFARGNIEDKTIEKPSVLRVAALAGPSGLGMSQLIGMPPTLAGNVATTFEIEGSVDVLLPKLVNGDIDIGILPPNIAAKLYNLNPGSVVAAAIVGNGMISLVTRDAAIRSFSDLAGKTVTVAGQGATPEYVFRALLAAKGIEPESVTLDFSIPVPEIAASLISNKTSYALLPEPFATVAVLNGKIPEDMPVFKAIDLRDSWKESGLGEDFPMTLCVVRSEFAQKHPELVSEFLELYRASIEWTVENPAEAGVLSEKVGLGLKAAIAARAIPSSNYVFIPAREGKASIEQLLSVFIKYAPAAIGGRLPDDGFYLK